MDQTKQKQKILLVDDNEIIRIYFREVFWIHGLESQYFLEMAETIHQALELINMPETRPDIIFLGLVMPMEQGGRKVTSPEAGFSLLSKVKSDPVLQTIRVVIFSGYDQKEYQERAKELGADAYLLKQENMPQELIKFIERLNKKTGGANG
jgi:CheY-like chemotaxis protein